MLKMKVIFGWQTLNEGNKLYYPTLHILKVTLIVMHKLKCLKSYFFLNSIFILYRLRLLIYSCECLIPFYSNGLQDADSSALIFRFDYCQFNKMQKRQKSILGSEKIYVFMHVTSRVTLCKYKKFQENLFFFRSYL